MKDCAFILYGNSLGYIEPNIHGFSGTLTPVVQDAEPIKLIRQNVYIY